MPEETPQSTPELRMAVTRVRYSDLISLFSLTGNRIRYVMNGPIENTIELLIEGPQMPVVQEGSSLPLVTLMYKRNEDGTLAFVGTQNVQPNPE